MSSRNLVQFFADLPDKSRLGVKLMADGLALCALRFAWEWISPASFFRVSATFMHYEAWGRDRVLYPVSASDLGDLLLAAAALSFLSGALIFLRRGFWWVGEHRSEKEHVTQLNIK